VLIRGVLALMVLLAGLAWPTSTRAQDVEPRRWTHMPVGMNVVAVVYGHTEGDVLFDPVLLIDDAEVEIQTAIASYVRAFNWGGKTARLDVGVPFQSARWAGLLEGQPASARRNGPADSRLRLSVNLIGAPALKSEAFGKYHADNPVNTVFGVALAVTLPTGEYKEDKLLNLGANRFIIRPQLGVLHTRGKWSFELSSSVFFFTDNDDFWDGSELEQDPLFAAQGHVARVFKPRLWGSIGVGYGWEGEYVLNGAPSNDPKDKLLSGLAFGFPVTRTQGMTLAYIRNRALEDVGSDTDSLVLGWSMRF